MSADDFYLRATSGIALFSSLELIHPDFTLRFQNWDDEGGILLTSLLYQYADFEVGFSNVSTDLEQEVTVNFFEGQVDVLKGAINSANTASPISCTWKRYRSDDYNVPLDTRSGLIVLNPSMNHTGLSFIAKAQGLNSVATGERYTLERYPLLRGTIN